MDQKDAYKRYIFKLLSRKDYTKFEILEKTKTKNFNSDDVLAFIKELENKNLYNEKNIALNLLNYYSDNLYYGIKKIKYIFQKKGFPKETIQLVLGYRSEEQEIETAIKALKKRGKFLANFEDFELRQKFIANSFNYLISKGFSIENAEYSIKQFIK